MSSRSHPTRPAASRGAAATAPRAAGPQRREDGLPGRWLELVLLAVVVTAGAALRWVHLGTPSLWWDEVIDIAMAQAGSVGDVLRVVRDGVPAGSANAGAMPLDYLLLHGWMAAVPLPRPEGIETYFRFPAFVW